MQYHVHCYQRVKRLCTMCCPSNFVRLADLVERLQCSFITKLVACSVVEQLQWHQNSVQQWPIELRSTYCLVILKAIRETLTAEQQGCMLTDATVRQLCQAVGCATGLGNIATNLQAGAAWEQACCSHLAHVTYSIQLGHCTVNQQPHWLDALYDVQRACASLQDLQETCHGS